MLFVPIATAKELMCGRRIMANTRPFQGRDESSILSVRLCEVECLLMAGVSRDAKSNVARRASSRDTSHGAESTRKLSSGLTEFHVATVPLVLRLELPQSLLIHHRVSSQSRETDAVMNVVAAP